MTTKTRQTLLFFRDIFLLYLSLLITLYLRPRGIYCWVLFIKHLPPFTMLYLFWLIVFYIFGFYDLNLFKDAFSFYPRMITALSVNFALGIIFFYLTPFFKIAPKTILFLNTLVFGLLLLGWRKIFYYLFSSYFSIRVAIIGLNPQARDLAEEIVNRPYLGYKLTAFFENGPPPANFLFPEVKISQIRDDFHSQIQKERINTLIITANFEQNSGFAKSLYQYLPERINLMDLSRAYEIICGKIPISLITRASVLENFREKTIYDKVKRIMDILLATLMLLITLPLWPFIALAIKFKNPGPIFYSQERIGRHGKPFLLIKFRSMEKDAEKSGQPIWAQKEDSRITKAGRFLRRTHLDEIPQLLNVLRGDISLVGPRPERPEFAAQLEKEIPYFLMRHIIKPGFTGWAQIKFRYARSVTDSLEKFQYDLYYLKNRSLMLDLQIILDTFQLLFRKE